MVTKVLIGLLVAAGLFLVYSLLTSGKAVAGGRSVGTGSGMGSPRPLDRAGQAEFKANVGAGHF